RFGEVENVPKLRMDRRLPAANLHDVRLPFIANDRIEHLLDLLQGAPRFPLRRRLRIANRALQIAAIRYLDQGQTAMLLMIGTKPAIVRAAIANRRVPM